MPILQRPRKVQQRLWGLAIKKTLLLLNGCMDLAGLLHSHLIQQGNGRVTWQDGTVIQILEYRSGTIIAVI